MEKTYTIEEVIAIQSELDEIKFSLVNNTKLLKIAVRRVLDSTAKELSSNLLLLEKALADSYIDEPKIETPNTEAQA